MGKRSKKSRKKFLGIELILLLVICGSIYISYSYHNQTIKKEDLFSSLLSKSHNLDSNLKKKELELKELNNDISKYKNLDSSIDEVKKEYFKNLKELEDSIINGKSKKKIAYLTFDDGPYYNTYKVLDILDKNNIKATFFTTNINGEYCHDNKSENCWKVYKEYIKRGHTIANHTYTHAIRYGLYNSTDTFMDAVIKQENLVKEKTGGYVTKILRFPGGSSQAKELKEPIIKRLRERGYGYVDWSAQDGDGGNLKTREQAWSTFTNSIDNDIEVVLFHDYNWITTDILPDAIKYLKNKGYEMYPLFYESNMIKK